MAAPPVTRIAIISPYPVVRHGIEAMLSHIDDIEVVTTGEQDGHLAGLAVVVYDLLAVVNDRVQRGGELTHLVEYNAAVVGIVPSLHHPVVQRAADLGVTEVVPFDVGADVLVTTLREAAERAGARQPTRTAPATCLTERQAAILALIARGWSNRRIAEHLFVSPNTVKTHVRELYERIGARSRVEAVTWFLLHGPADGERS